MFLVNSRLGLFSAACVSRHPFSLSYGVILPSSLTTVLWLALGYSPHPPVSVCGTGTFNLDRDFSRQCEISYFATKFRSPSYPSIIKTDLPILTASVLSHTQPTVWLAYPTVSSHFSNGYWWYRNINLLSITYAFRPRLRSRLTQGGRTFPWKPWVYGPWDSHPRLATHANILTRILSTCPYGHASACIRSSPTHHK